MRPSARRRVLPLRPNRHVDRRLDVALAVDGGEDDLVADLNERGPVAALGPTRRAAREAVDAHAPAARADRADEQRVALRLMDEVREDPLLDDLGLAAANDPVLDALERPAVEAAGVRETDLPHASLALEGHRAPETLAPEQRDIGYQPRANDADTNEAASLRAGRAHEARDVTSELELAEPRCC